MNPQLCGRSERSEHSPSAFPQGSFNHFFLVGSKLARQFPRTFRKKWRGIQLSSTEKFSASHTTTERSTTFCSSRTFPGHAYDKSRSSVFLFIPRKLFPAFLAK